MGDSREGKPRYFNGKAPNGVIPDRGARQEATEQEVEESQREK